MAQNNRASNSSSDYSHTNGSSAADEANGATQYGLSVLYRRIVDEFNRPTPTFAEMKNLVDAGYRFRCPFDELSVPFYRHYQ